MRLSALFGRGLQWVLMENSRPSLVVTCLEMLAVFVIALAVMSQFISPTPHIDEFLHVLSARSLVDDGTLMINEGGGPYTRARAYTYAVAACYRLFGESWASARLPSLLAGALLVTAVFGWLGRVAGRRAAWIGAFLLGMASDVIGFSSMVRFYMPHALLVWLTAVCVYAIVTGKLARTGRIVVGALALVCGLLAWHLQTTTAIAALVLTLWAGSEFVGLLVRCDREQRRRAVVWLVLVITAGVPAVWLGLEFSGALSQMVEKFQTPRLWSIPQRGEVAYYHRFFGDSYPLLWTGFIFAAVAALATRRRPAWFCLVVFVAALIIHSLMPFKNMRYLAYAWPFFFALWAIALDGLLLWLHTSARSVLGQVFGEPFALRRWVGHAVWAFLVFGLLCAAWVSPEYKLSRKMLTGQAFGPYAREDWTTAAKTLESIARETRFVVCSEPPKAVYYLGRLDVELSVSQAAGRDEFTDHRITGRPVITTAESVQRLIQEHPSGLIVIEADHFGARWFVPTETALYIQNHTQPIELPQATGVKAFRWGPVGQTLSDPETP